MAKKNSQRNPKTTKHGGLFSKVHGAERKNMQAHTKSPKQISARKQGVQS